MQAVFSAQAEVFLRQPDLRGTFSRFLRASGGVSICESWARCAKRVFSAQAKVLLPIYSQLDAKKCFLRASGGASPDDEGREDPLGLLEIPVDMTDYLTSTAKNVQFQLECCIISSKLLYIPNCYRS